MHSFLLQSLTIGTLAIAAYGLPQSAPIDPADPNKSDPTVIPGKDFALPDARTPEPPDIRELPDGCDPTKFTQDCINKLDTDDQGAYLWFEKDHGTLHPVSPVSVRSKVSNTPTQAVLIPRKINSNMVSHSM